MTIGNVTAGFRVYPVDRDVFSSLADQAALPKASGISFIPLYSPASKRATRLQVEAELQVIEDEEEFTEEECILFERRFANGYDLTHDPQYNL